MEIEFDNLNMATNKYEVCACKKKSKYVFGLAFGLTQLCGET